ncbi:hypothetical protein [Nitrosomonas sp. sh817]|uniref:hypothetical protein n=1 Tax=Nitrosomonas sp. sh817 TaxID=3070658 RepID=UPI0027DDDE14|nr:hypothetical protein [Nitrosomonas sp. sh817]WMJ09837.1 hypothetical protein RBH92_06475 [Nitrosomonas sp. sh817]
MLKRYYSIEEAAEFLTSEHGQRITHKDVLTLARHGDIRLCTWFDGRVDLCICYDHPEHPTVDWEDTFSFKGYVQIPRDKIAPNGGEITFSPKNSIEIITYDGPPLAEVVYPYGFSWWVETNCDNADIPAQDLLNLRSKKVELEKPLATTERNTLLTIIGLMAKNGYGDDLSQPYQLAKKIQEAAELQGIKISDDTIAKKLKEAKKILVEESE